MSRFTPRSQEYYRLRQRVKNEEPICHLCGQWIDPKLGRLPGTEPSERRFDPLSFSLDHDIPASIAPHLALVRSNCHAAHLVCNQRKQQGNSGSRKSTQTNTSIPPFRVTDF